jgi:hypothetical protein
MSAFYNPFCDCLRNKNRFLGQKRCYKTKMIWEPFFPFFFAPLKTPVLYVINLSLFWQKQKKNFFGAKKIKRENGIFLFNWSFTKTDR